MEKLRREHCPKCGSTVLENILQFKTGEKIRVYVRCQKCKTFAARYTLERYASDKTYESFLKNLAPNRLSPKKILEEMDFISKDIQSEFERINNSIEEIEVKDKKIEDIIVDSSDE